MGASSRAMLRRATTQLLRRAIRTAAPSPAAAALRRPYIRQFAIKVDSSSHSDFAPQSNQQLPDSITERIEQDLAADDVVLYMKGVPSAPQCGFSNAVVRVLEAEGVNDYAAYNVLEDPGLRYYDSDAPRRRAGRNTQGSRSEDRVSGTQQ